MRSRPLCCNLLYLRLWLTEFGMYGQRAVKCTVWSDAAVTSSRSPKGSQKVTALPCISTPHCSPTSQLLHSDLRWRGEHRGETGLHESQKFRHRCGKRSHPAITRGVVTFPPTRCLSRALPGGWSRSRHAARHACRGAPLSKHTTPCAHS